MKHNITKTRDAAKALIRRKFIKINNTIKIERSKINLFLKGKKVVSKVMDMLIGLTVVIISQYICILHHQIKLNIYAFQLSNISQFLRRQPNFTPQVNRKTINSS